MVYLFGCFIDVVCYMGFIYFVNIICCGFDIFFFIIIIGVSIGVSFGLDVNEEFFFWW